MTHTYALAVHGGAGTILPSEMTAEKEKQYRQALEQALLGGQEILRNGGSSVEAVAESVRVLEDCPLFNAGKGSVFDADGGHEMEAAIMNGADLNAGAVAALRQVQNPILLSKAVLEHSSFVFLSGKGALDFALEHALPLQDDAYFYDEFRHSQWQKAQASGNVQLDHSVEKKYGTVGAVARDQAGNLAAATSTGGLTNKKYGRIGDSSLIGAGTYANNRTCAVSCTGYGEFFIRAVAAYDLSALMEYQQLSLREASDLLVMHKLPQLGGEGGLIAIDAQGNISMKFNSTGMYRGWISENAPAPHTSIYLNA
jgi:beta-aspartyl-peptidase (threonine type)